MTLRDWADLGQLLGGIGVIVSLVYLALQVRQHTAQLREQERLVHADTVMGLAQLLSPFRIALAQNKELASLWRRGLAGEALDADDLLRFDTLLAERLGISQTGFLRAAQNPIDAQFGRDNAARYLGDLFANSGARARWPSLRRSFTAQFQAEVDRALAELEAAQ